MARKKASNSAGNGILIVFAMLIAAVASVPKNAWIAVGVVASIGAIMWLLARRSKQKHERTTPPTITRPEAPVAEKVTLNILEVTPTYDSSQAEPEFYTVQTVSEPAPSFKIPTPEAVTPTARWVPPAEQVSIGDFSLSGGMIYVGALLGGYDSQEPSLINSKLRIASSTVDIHERLMPYWPSYQSITPEARRGYLQWLASGREDPSADTGYVFLFFYGLERRALVDAVSNPEARADIPLIIREVERLITIYGDSRSFRSYATGFLSHLGSSDVDPDLYLGQPPAVTPNAYEMPMPLRIGLGQHAVNKRPLNAEWALSWALTDPNIGRRTPVARCGEVFATLFKVRYERFHPAGLILPLNKTRLKTSYRPASAVLRAPAVSIGDLPDVMATSATRKIIQLLVEVCTGELEAFSRYLGRNPEGAETLEGLLQLPTMLWPASVRSELSDLQAKIGDDFIVMSFGELAGRFKSAGTLSRDKVLALARALESLHIGMEPDVLAGSKTPKPEDRIALFVTQPEDGSLRASAAYNAASVTLDLASAVASADGDTSLEEVTLLSHHINSWNHLSVAHQKRLKAHLQIQLQQPPTLASLKKKLDPLPADAKRTIASFLAHLAHADGTVSPSEVKLLERVYKTLLLDSQLLYSDLHGAAAGIVANPVPSSATSDPAAPSHTAADGGFKLDHNRIAQLQQETAAVSALLAQVFTEEQVEEPEPAVAPASVVEENSSGISGLDLEHSAFLRLLVSRAEWSRSELEEAANDMELMLDGALEQINDMAFDRFNMPVTEGDDPVEINSDILEELAL